MMWTLILKINELRMYVLIDIGKDSSYKIMKSLTHSINHTTGKIFQVSHTITSRSTLVL